MGNTNPTTFVWRLSQLQQELMNGEALPLDQRFQVASYFGAIAEALTNPKGTDWALAAQRAVLTNEQLMRWGYMEFDAFTQDVKAARLAALPD